MQENPVEFLKKGMKPEVRDKVSLFIDLRENPLLAIKGYVPESIKENYELAVEMKSDPSKAFAKCGIKKKQLK
jgi:hypothetical protein